MEEASATRKVQQYVFSTNDLLGKGATGSVYSGTHCSEIGRDTSRGTRVALKVIDMAKIDNEVTVYLLSNEKRALETLRHPNVILTHDIFQEQDYCYIITEFCNQGTLSDLIQKRGRLSEEEALLLFRSIAEGYRACVPHGIIHRDIKPANVLLNDGIPKLSDFGYCEISGTQKPKIFYNVGSPSYMSPEAFVVNLYSEKSDVWSLGVVLYEMVVGQTFDGGGDIMECISNVGKFGVPFPAHVGPYCKYVINQCLNLDPKKRINLEQLINILDNREQVSTEISRSNSSRQLEGVSNGRGIATATDIPAAMQNQHQVQRSNTLRQISVMPSQQQQQQRPQVQMPSQFPQRVQQILQPQQQVTQQRPQTLMPQFQKAVQPNKQQNRMEIEENNIRPVTHYNQPNHYQQMYEQTLHQNSSRSAQEPQGLPRLLSHHVRLQNDDRRNYISSEPNEAIIQRNSERMVQEQALRKVPSLQNAIFKAKTDYIPDLNQSLDFIPRSDRGIVIPTQRPFPPPFFSPQQSFRSTTTMPQSLPPRPVTHFIPQQHMQTRCITAATNDARDRFVRSILTDGSSMQEFPPQYTQKPFQKPHTVNHTEAIRPDSQAYHSLNSNFNPFSPNRLPEKVPLQNVGQSPISPVYSTDFMTNRYESASQKAPVHQVPPAYSGSFKKPIMKSFPNEQLIGSMSYQSVQHPKQIQQGYSQSQQSSQPHQMNSIPSSPDNRNNPFTRTQPQYRTNMPLQRNSGNSIPQQETAGPFRPVR